MAHTDEAFRNTTPITTEHPGVILIGTDGSRSTGDKSLDGRRRCCEEISAAGNEQINALISACGRGDRILDRWLLGGIVFADDRIEPLLPAPANTTNGVFPLSTVAANPLEIDPSTGTGVWIRTKPQGSTPMCAALQRMYDIAVTHLSVHPETSVFTGVLVSDGMPTDGDPRSAAEQFRSLDTQSCPVTLMTVSVSVENNDSVMFPADPDALPDSFSRLMFDMASPMPPYLLEAARREGLELAEGARAFVHNADAAALFLALKIGTVTAMQQQR